MGFLGDHKGLDPFDVPPEARKMMDEVTARPSPSLAASLVRIIVPTGMTVKVVQQA